MGARLIAYYERAFRMGGYPAKVELARLTKIPSTQAAILPDSPSFIRQFEDAMKQVRSTGQAQKDEDKNLSLALARVKVEVLRNRLSPSEAARRITQTATSALGVERCSIWSFIDGQAGIRCVDLYSTKESRHSTGLELKAGDFPTYFAAIVTEKTIAADDAHRDPRTAEFSRPYLKPLGINSMLDVPIWRRGRIYGVLCNEHTGPARKWTPEEEDFGYGAGSLFGLVLD